jgi:S-adenosylmethionine:tRNA ribosyltransferase-isomerase
MNLCDFDFPLPEHLIAQKPSEAREQSRLLSVNREEGSLRHNKFFELGEFLQAGDLLVMNNSRTMNARLFAQKQSGGKIEILIEQITSSHSAKALIKCSRKPKLNEKIIIQGKDEITTKAQLTQREGQWFWLTFEQPVLQTMQFFGHLPLPPYIKRPQGATLDDAKRYQTIYAEELGSVATPTAGLHFSEPLLQQLKEQKIDIGFLTLHVGSGTFQPIREEVIENHTMHNEFIQIDQTLCEQIKHCQKIGGRVIAVGTTSARALETMARKYSTPMPYSDYSDIFLYPGMDFKIIQGLITNFHLPKSTLFILVCAFANTALMKQAYQEAIDESYRFFSYGDAMFIL